MFIAVGDQRRERVHMVGVLYHWNLIRLRDKREEEDTEKDKMDSDKERGKEGREREKKRGEDVNIWDVS